MRSNAACLDLVESFPPTTGFSTTDFFSCSQTTFHGKCGYFINKLNMRYFWLWFKIKIFQLKTAIFWLQRNIAFKMASCVLCSIGALGFQSFLWTVISTYCFLMSSWSLFCLIILFLHCFFSSDFERVTPHLHWLWARRGSGPAFVHFCLLHFFNMKPIIWNEKDMLCFLCMRNTFPHVAPIKM